MRKSSSSSSLLLLSVQPADLAGKALSCRRKKGGEKRSPEGKIEALTLFFFQRARKGIFMYHRDLTMRPLPAENLPTGRREDRKFKVCKKLSSINYERGL